jgi:hypothetical protein
LLIKPVQLRPFEIVFQMALNIHLRLFDKIKIIQVSNQDCPVENYPHAALKNLNTLCPHLEQQLLMDMHEIA